MSVDTGGRTPAGRRGDLRVYLGSAPGVGKTFAMLEEGHRRARRGTDVAVAFVETHGRPSTVAALEGLEVLPRKEVSYRGGTFGELDVEAALTRRPQVVLVDELAHTNIPGSEREKRWQDVELLLEAGIDVITTVNAQHLESLNDVVQQITGVPQRETVPDAVVRAAEQIQLVDMTPEALRRRMAHGNIYNAEKVDAALSNFFRVGNLTALRELALLWLADSVEDGLQKYREQHGINAVWETKERVVVALTGGPEGDTLIRRAARVAARSSGGELIAVHVSRSDGLAGTSVAALEQQRVLVESLGGSYHSTVGDDVPTALLEVARSLSASQIVVGASRRPPWKRALTGGGSAATIIRLSGPIDVHVVTHDYAGKGQLLPRFARGVTRRRQIQSMLVGLVLLVAITPILTALRQHLSVASDVEVYLVVVVAVAVLGGLAPGVAAAVTSALLLNFYFTAPVHSFSVAHVDDAVALVAFVLVALMVSIVVEAAARRSSEAVRASAESETLATLAGSVLRGQSALPALLERVQETFGVTSVALLRFESGAPASSVTTEQGSLVGGGRRGRYTVLASAGPDLASCAATEETEIPVRDGLVLVTRGRQLPAEDRRVLTAFAATVGVAYEQRRLASEVERTAPLLEADRVRSALLAAVSHDLRTPLAGVKAAVSTLRARDVVLDLDVQEELLAGAEEDVDRLTHLVSDLLDLSRLEAGALSVFTVPTALEDVVARALDHAAVGRHVDIELPDDLPLASADPALLERVVANLVQNALRYSPESAPVIRGSQHDQLVELRVVDRGPGIPEDERERVFTAFQRMDDSTNGDGPGVGLGLAISRGFTQAMGGTLTPEDTPGGGLTMNISLAVAKPGAGAAAPEVREVFPE